MRFICGWRWCGSTPETDKLRSFERAHATPHTLLRRSLPPSSRQIEPLRFFSTSRLQGDDLIFRISQVGLSPKASTSLTTVIISMWGLSLTKKVGNKVQGDVRPASTAGQPPVVEIRLSDLPPALACQTLPPGPGWGWHHRRRRNHLAERQAVHGLRLCAPDQQLLHRGRQDGSWRLCRCWVYLRQEGRILSVGLALLSTARRASPADGDWQPRRYALDPTWLAPRPRLHPPRPPCLCAATSSARETLLT